MGWIENGNRKKEKEPVMVPTTAPLDVPEIAHAVADEVVDRRAEPRLAIPLSEQTRERLRILNRIFDQPPRTEETVVSGTMTNALSSAKC